MSELQALTTQRDGLLAKIREIEASCEGIENEHNAQRVQELNLEHAQLSAQKQELSGKLSALEARLSAISSEIAQLSGTGIDRILEAIKNQRWYFFKNKTKVLMDRDTGLLWANLNYFNYNNGSNDKRYHRDDAYPLVDNLSLDEITNWYIPTYDELWNAIDDKTFPFVSGGNWNIMNCNWWFAFSDNKQYNTVDLNSKGSKYDYGSSMCILPCSSVLVINSNYEKKCFSKQS